jgi:hypothetical protein
MNDILLFDLIHLSSGTLVGLTKKAGHEGFDQYTQIDQIQAALIAYYEGTRTVQTYESWIDVWNTFAGTPDGLRSEKSDLSALSAVTEFLLLER